MTSLYWAHTKWLELLEKTRGASVFWENVEELFVFIIAVCVGCISMGILAISQLNWPQNMLLVILMRSLFPHEKFPRTQKHQPAACLPQQQVIDKYQILKDINNLLSQLWFLELQWVLPVYSAPRCWRFGLWGQAQLGVGVPWNCCHCFKSGWF